MSISILTSSSVFVDVKTEVTSLETSLTYLAIFYSHNLNIKAKYRGFIYALSFI